MEAKRAAVPTAGSERSEILARARALATSTWTLGAFVFLLTWSGGLAPAFTPHPDVSLHAGMNMAVQEGLRYGPDLALTYGPLGFLKSYLAFYEWPARLAIVYGLALHLAVSLSVVWALRRNFGLIVSLVLGLVVAALLRGELGALSVREDAAAVVLATIWSIAAIAPRAPGFARPLLLYGGGVFAAIELLAKLNTGLVVLAVVAIAAVAMEGDRKRNLASLGATLLGSLAVLWVASGQAIGDVGSFVSGSLEVVSGYSSGARVEFGWEDRGYDYVVAPIVLAVAIAIAWVSSREVRTVQRAAIFLVLALVAFSAYKAGFVAHEIWHMTTFYATMLGAYVAFPMPSRLAERGFALAATVALAATAILAVSFGGYPRTDPLDNVENAAATLAALVDGDELDAEIAENRARLTAQFELDEGSLELLEGHSVHVDPTEASAAWAYELDWEPLPAFQSYGAWTPELDEENADALASPDGPERVLRQRLEVLGRYPGFESPAAMIAMLCNFEALSTTETWQVLGRVPDRCGEPRAIGTAEGAYGEPIPVPPAPEGSVVFARVDGVQVSGIESLRTLLARSRGRTITFGGGPVWSDSNPRAWTLVPQTAGDGLLLRAPPGADFPAPFALAPNPETVTFRLDEGNAVNPVKGRVASSPAQDAEESSDELITVDFFAMPISAGGAGPGP